MDYKISRPVVSILMSVYNEPLEWIQQAIDSILTQTFTDFEFIIINDKPDREDLKVFLNRNAAKDSRIKIHTNSENIGLPKSLNIGLKLCKGKYIARMDADDISLPERLIIQKRYLDNNPEIGVCGSFAEKINENNKRIGKIKLFTSPVDLKNGIYFFCPFVHPSVMIRKVITDKYKYDENCRVAQDWNLWLRLSKKYSFANLRSVLLYYRVHSNQSQKKAGAKRSAESRAYSDAIFASELGLNSSLRTIFIRSRGDMEVDDKELYTLYRNLIENQSLGEARFYAMRVYIRKRLNRGTKLLLTDRLIWTHPYITIRSILVEIKRRFQ